MSAFHRARQLFRIRRALLVLDLPKDDRDMLGQLADNLHRQFKEIDRWQK